MNVGICKLHSRDFEGFCSNCYVIICPSCVIFGEHKKHDVLSLQEGAMFIREQIFQIMKKGLFSKEFCEEKILSIKEKRLLCEKYKAETVKEIENSFKGISNCLKIRKILLIHKIIEFFNEEQNKIFNAENDWQLKHNLIEKINSLYNENNNHSLLSNTNTIMKGIKKVCEPIKFTEISIYDNIDTCLKIDNHEYTLDEIISAFEKYITILSPNILTYKC